MPVGRIPLAGPLGERTPAAGKDVLLKNCYKETVRFVDEPMQQEGAAQGQSQVFVEKRPGLKAHQDMSAATTDTGRGCVNWNGAIYSVIGDEIFKDTTDIGQIETTSGRVHFDIAIDAESPSENVLVFHDGTTIYAIDDENTFLEIGADKSTDIEALDFTMVPGIVVLDQYVLVMKANGNIYNSTVGDVTAGYTDFLNLEMKLDNGVRIARYINYLVGFGEDTIEILYDAANSTGSPFNRFEGMGMLIGCAAANSVANCDNALVWVAKSADGGRFIAKLEGGFDHQRISTTALDAILDKEAGNIGNSYGYHVRHGGHSFYVLTLPTTAARTFVYQFEEDEWTEWTSDISDTEAFFQCMDSAEVNGKQILLDDSTGKSYEFDAATFQDATTGTETIKVQILTAKIDNGTMQNKFMSRLQAIGDLNSSTGTISIAWSDDDYQTFTTDRTQDLDNHQSWLTRLGMYKRRAFRIKHEQNLPMRLSHLEVNGETGHYGKS